MHQYPLNPRHKKSLKFRRLYKKVVATILSIPAFRVVNASAPDGIDLIFFHPSICLTTPQTFYFLVIYGTKCETNLAGAGVAVSGNPPHAILIFKKLSRSTGSVVK